MAASPQFITTPKAVSIPVSVANTNLDGTGSLGTGSFSAGSSGSRVEKINIQSIVTTTAGMIRLFLYDGSAYSLLKEIPVLANTPSATNPAFSFTLTQDNDSILPLILPNGWSIKASTHNAEAFRINIFGGDF